MKRMLLLLVACAMVSVAEETAKPQHLWNFDKVGWWSHQATDLGCARHLPEMRGRIAVGQGVDGSSALIVDAADYCPFYVFHLPYESFTVDVAFRLSSPLDGKTARTLIHYSWLHDVAHRLMLHITGDGRIEYLAGEFRVRTERLGLVDGRLYSLRLAVSAQGKLSAWLDGRQVLAAEGAPSFKSIQAEVPKNCGYPLLLVGSNYDKGGKSDLEPLVGILDDLAIYDVALGAPAPKVEPPVDYSRIALPEFKPVDGARAEALSIGAAGRVGTGRFQVLDHEEGVLGQMKRADEKFFENAAQAEVSVGADDIKVVFDCPVPAGMETAKRRDAWSGDRVEFYLRPSTGSKAFFCIAAGASGVWEAHAFKAPGSRDYSWKPSAAVVVKESAKGFRVEMSLKTKDVFAALPVPGEAFGVNFVRHGATCGGKSLWAVTGGEFNLDCTPMGLAVMGGGKPYFARRLQAAEARVARDFRRPAARAAAEKALARVREAVAAHGGAESAFVALETMFAKLDRAFVQIALDARELLVYRPADAWGNELDPDRATRPLELLRVKAPLNARTLVPIAISNFRGEEFIGQLKFIETSQGLARSDWYRPFVTNGVARHFTVRRGLAIRNRQGNRLYDPVVELPHGTLFNLAPGESAPVYLELDTHGMCPGRHYALFVVRRAIPGFPSLRVPVEVEVLNADLDSVGADRFGYTFLDSTFHPTRHACPNYARRLVDRGYNMVTVFNNYTWPRCDKGGKWLRPDFTSLDALADTMLAAGLDRERMKFVVYLACDAGSMKRDAWVGLRDHEGKLVPFASPKWEEGMRFYLAEFLAHVGERYGVGRDRVYWYTVDEPSGDIDDPKLESSLSRAYYVAKFIKGVNQGNLTMTDPYVLTSKTYLDDLRKLSEVYDVLEFYRPHLVKGVLENVLKLGLREVWTYSIINKETPPVVYALDHWKNMRDGFREISAWWHMDQGAGGDVFDSTDGGDFTVDYATLYVDFDLDDAMLSRRQLAADQAHEDAKLIMFLRGLFRNDKAKLDRIQAIVESAAEGGTMQSLDAARAELLELIPCAQR